MSNIYAIADLHGQLPEVPGDADVVLIAGDIVPDFYEHREDGSNIALQSDWLDSEFRAWLGSFDAEVVACWGNHDYVGEHPALIPDLPWTLLQDSEAVVAGVRVYGTPWVPNLQRWAFYASWQALKARADMIPDCDVLMSHGPPYGYGDFVPYNQKYAEKYGTPLEGEHVGDSALLGAIKRLRPAVTICGHIHESRGRHVYEDNLILNVAAVNERYEMRARPFELLDL